MQVGDLIKWKECKRNKQKTYYVERGFCIVTKKNGDEIEATSTCGKIHKVCPHEDIVEVV